MSRSHAHGEPDPIAVHDRVHSCGLCGGETWWRACRPGSPWICGCCLPPTIEPHEFEWREVIPAPEVTP